MGCGGECFEEQTGFWSYQMLGMSSITHPPWLFFSCFFPVSASHRIWLPYEQLECSTIPYPRLRSMGCVEGQKAESPWQALHWSVEEYKMTGSSALQHTILPLKHKINLPLLHNRSPARFGLQSKRTPHLFPGTFVYLFASLLPQPAPTAQTITNTKTITTPQASFSAPEAPLAA